MLKLRILAACISGLALILPPNIASGQETTISVLIDESFRTTADRFLSNLVRSLPEERQSAITFESRVVPAAQLGDLLARNDWAMAIISSSSLAQGPAPTAIAAFQLPFAFSETRGVINFQQSAYGRAALSAFTDRGWKGLTYLNAGRALVAGVGMANIPADLSGRLVATMSLDQAASLKAIGSSTIVLGGGDARMTALTTGKIDAAVVDSVAPLTELGALQDGFVLRDGLEGHVAILVTNSQVWDHLPFVDRAMISDAAVATSQTLDTAALEAEASFLAAAEQQGLILTRFGREEAEGATNQWIAEQPEGVRGFYSSVLRAVRETETDLPLAPPEPGRRGGATNTFHFATTRLDTGYADPRYRFSDARTGTITCGTAQYTRTFSLENISVVHSNTTECIEYIKSVVAEADRTMIFVHGFNNRFSDAAERAALLDGVVGSGTDVLLWSWPAKREGIGGDYDYDKESVGGVAESRFSQLLTTLVIQGDRKNNLSILAHSMGAWHTLNALRHFDLRIHLDAISNIVFAAPDIPTDEFGFALDDGLARISSLMTLYACIYDAALSLLEYQRTSSRWHRRTPSHHRPAGD